jgi:hypothetical protein
MKAAVLSMQALGCQAVCAGDQLEWGLGRSLLELSLHIMRMLETRTLSCMSQCDLPDGIQCSFHHHAVA